MKKKRLAPVDLSAALADFWTGIGQIAGWLQEAADRKRWAQHLDNAAFADRLTEENAVIRRPRSWVFYRASRSAS